MLFFLLVLLSFKSDVDISNTTESAILCPLLDTTTVGEWADSVLNSLTPEERIAQLFMVAAYSKKGPQHVDQVSELVQNYKIGGLIFFQGGPVRQAIHTNHYQSLAKVPLLISIDGEWGLAMRLDSTQKYPRQMMLGAIQNDSLIYQMGADIAKQCKRLGIHVNLAPVVDVNNNPLNPVINSRSFGENKYNVAKKGIAYMKGMQDQGVMANAKHFPGHGDTDSDSHKTLPIINHNLKRLDSLELYPFKQLIKEGLTSMMVAHLYIPELDSSENTASTLSEPIVTGLLKEKLGFEGLIFTDALNMKGVSKYFAPGEVDVKALLAGNDVLLFAEDVPRAIQMIKQAVADGKITQQEIDKRCLKVLKAKEWSGAAKFKKIEVKNLYEDLNTNASEVLNRELVKNSLTLLRNEDNLIPLKRLDTLKIASVSIGGGLINEFQKMLENYTKVDHYNVHRAPTLKHMEDVLRKVKDHNLVVISIHETKSTPSRNFGISQQAVRLVNKIAQKHKVILDVFASPYSLDKFFGAEKKEGLIVSYQDNKRARELSAQLIFGGVKANGKLPVSGSSFFKQGSGITTKKTRLAYTIPEATGLKASSLKGIDKIAMAGVNNGAYPGCQVLVAKQGEVIYRKAFGHHTYGKKRPVLTTDIYDLASITKIAASTLAVMSLQEQGLFHVDCTLNNYLPDLVDSSAFEKMIIREMLAHQAGLASWIPFYMKTINEGKLDGELYSKEPSEAFSNRVAENLFMTNAYKDVILQRILSTKVKSKRYRYSDMGYYLLQEIIQRITNERLDQYMDQHFYSKLGATTLTYLPREKFDLSRITPTETDRVFRKQTIHGDVHDPGAAMMGGIGGHAGLFSNANDLAKLMQMYLEGGTYGGEYYLSSALLDEFTDCQYCETNRRGAGFDKPFQEDPGGPTCGCVSFDSFGHTGFTGTYAWADPEHEVVYIFLSNRIHPSAGNSKLIKMNIRTDIQRVIYDAIDKTEK